MPEGLGRNPHVPPPICMGIPHRPPCTTLDPPLHAWKRPRPIRPRVPTALRDALSQKTTSPATAGVSPRTPMGTRPQGWADDTPITLRTRYLCRSPPCYPPPPEVRSRIEWPKSKLRVQLLYVGDACNPWTYHASRDVRFVCRSSSTTICATYS
jgi:hypothetical protein